MTSLAKIRANRRNALKSTGPRTRAGKAKVARNARTHGLNIPTICDPGFAREVVEVAREIETSVTGAEADATGHELACRIAEAMIDMRRVRLAKLPLVATLDADPGDRHALTRLWRLDRYEARAFVRRRRAIRAFDVVALPLRFAKQTQRRNVNDFREGARTSPLAQPHPEERSRSERVSKDGPHVQRRHIGRPMVRDATPSASLLTMRRSERGLGRIAKQSQRRNASDSKHGTRMSPRAQPHPEERSRSERVSKDGPHEAGPGRAILQNKANAETPMISAESCAGRCPPHAGTHLSGRPPLA